MPLPQCFQCIHETANGDDQVKHLLAKRYGAARLAEPRGI
jgi:hypothetical protein